MDLPLAYHITFGTYGAHLHGDSRGSVDRRHNTPGEPALPADLGRQQREAKRRCFPTTVLTAGQRRWIEAELPVICERGGWGYHMAAAGPDHVHVLLSADVEGKRVRAWLKRWLGEHLSARWPLSDGQSWWSEGGSVKWVWDQAYFRRAFDYIASQRASD